MAQVGGIQRVLRFFLPKEEEFFSLFAQMSEQAYQAALLMQKTFQDYPEVGNVVAGIAELEHGPVSSEISIFQGSCRDLSSLLPGQRNPSEAVELYLIGLRLSKGKRELRGG